MPANNMFVCEKCGRQFANVNEYRQHKIEHTRGVQFDDITQGEDIIAEPIKAINEDELKAKPGELQEVKAPEWAKSTEDRKKAGIKLVYHYDGYCSTCASPVETLELDDILEDKKKIVVVAWCSSCKKKLRQRQVLKL